MAVRQLQRRATKVPEIRRGDTVVVLTGKDAGKRGTVERIVRNQQGAKKTQSKYGSSWSTMSPAASTAVVVEGLNIAKRHTKPRQSSNTTDRTPKITQGGILDLAQPLAIGKVMLVCTHCDKPTRIAHKTLDNGRRVRVCRHCGEQVEVRS
ncbi:MAG: 50S ribosomal protein L24 [Chloroflexi bacterium]|nr:MAG: 50S ribosomal protein L24 [Chloroflexota bacterium]